MCLAHPSSFEIALALLDHTQRGRKPVEPTLLQKRQSNVVQKLPVLIMSKTHRICWQKGQILALKPSFLWPKEGRDGFQLGCWVPSPQASTESSLSPGWFWPLCFQQSGSCLCSHSLCPKFRLHPACGNELLVKGSAELHPDKKLQWALPATPLWESLGAQTDPRAAPCQWTSISSCNWEAAVDNEWHREVWQDWQGWRSATECHQALPTPWGLELSWGRLPRRQESTMAAARWQVAPDSGRDPELSWINLWKEVENSSWKQRKQQGENSGGKCWSITEPYATLQR